MEPNINPSAISVVLILIAAASLFTMLSLNQINYMIHGDLYNFGLQFSYRWAIPYWIFSGIVFGLSWVNISLSIIVALYIFKKSRKQALGSENIPQAEKLEEAARFKEEKEQRKLSEYVEPQKERLTASKEPEEASSEEFIEEEVKQPEEPMEIVEAQEAQEAQIEPCKEAEEEIDPNKETAEVPIPPEDVEKRQSIL